MTTDVHVYFCTVVHNRWDNFKRLFRSFLDMNDSLAKLAVHDWASTDHPQIVTQNDFKNAAGGWPENGGVFYGVSSNKTDEKINRSRVRNMAFDLANPRVADIVFFVDCDMLLPLNMSTHLRSIVKKDVAYFPISYSLYEGSPPVVNGDGPAQSKGESTANGWWRDEGLGNCGFVAGDFVRIGKWDERFGDKYGGDDNDIHWRASTANIQIVRDRLDGFFHLWHPTTKHIRNPRLCEIPWHPLYRQCN